MLVRNLVRNRAGPRGHFLDADGGFALATEQHSLVSVEGAVPAQVHHHLVHADAAHNGMALTADLYLGLPRHAAHVSVAVANRQRDHTNLRLGLPRRAVADAGARLDNLEIDDIRCPTERRADVDGARQMRRRIGAIEQDAWANHVQACLRHLQHRRRELAMWRVGGGSERTR